ncbi:unnamed protein product [Auanema sp. JU1783]|nr:unnamed protein product [Auanema sp. JU1783]
MSLLPINTFPGMIFLEARMLAQSSAVISQVGLSIEAPECSVALFSRTSGVLLVAGVGSYCAYRICTNFLGRRFVWMLLESSRTDSIPTADRRLLYDCNIPYDGSLRIEEIDDDNDDEEDACNDQGDAASVEEFRSRVSESKSLSQISRSSRVRASTRAKGLFSLRHAHKPREGVLSRRSTTTSSQSSERSASPTNSERSASLQIVWEGGQDWEDEFANEPSTSTAIQPIRYRLEQSISNSENPIPAASVGDLCSIFDDVMSMTSGLDVPDEVLYGNDENSIEEEEETQLSHIKCLTDSKYMYSSLVAGSEFGSETGSSNNSPSRVKSFKRKKPEITGLWNFSPDEPCTSTTNSNLMTDSALSRSTQSKKSSHGLSMFDSAIGTDLMSSEEGSVGHPRLNPLREADNISIAQTDVSMEWYEDEGLRCNNPTEFETKLQIEGLDWEMDSNTPVHRAKDRAMCISSVYRPKSFRDLMVIACQQFQPYSPQFKILHEMYHRRRFRKLGQLDGEVTAEKQIHLLLHSLLYHQVRLLPGITWPQLEQKFKKCLEEFDFLHKCKERSVKDLQRHLHAIWDVIDLHVLSENDDHIKGLELLLILEAKAVYDEKMKGTKHPWFTYDNPSEIMHLFEDNKPLDEVSWNLICRLCDVSIEMVDLSASPQTSKYGNGSTILPWIRQRSSAQPLFFVPED